MNKLTLFALVMALSLGVMAENYAVLVAGSNYYFNYRHQADVCHAYHTLLKKGYKANNIIVMSFNDVAKDPSNPFPGQLFNKPSYKKPGVDVNKGCVIDYEGEDVTPSNYLAIIQGQKDKVKGGNGRVLESGPKDHVFLSFFDHGAPGLIAFPEEYLYATDLLSAFRDMFDNKKYGRLVYYLEACESGSMFQNLPYNLNIYAVTAANPYESSYAAYCGNQAVVNGKYIGSCLGDLFSISWMEDVDNHHFISHYSLQQQFVKVANLTKSSEVCQYGDLTFTSEPISDYMSRRTKSLFQTIIDYFKSWFTSQKEEEEENAQNQNGLGIINSRNAQIDYLQNKYANNPTNENYSAIVKSLELSAKFQNRFETFAKDFSVSGDKKPTTTNFDCYSSLINNFRAVCGKIPDDQLGQLKYFYEYCSQEKNYEGVNLLNYFKNVC